MKNNSLRKLSLFLFLLWNCGVAMAGQDTATVLDEFFQQHLGKISAPGFSVVVVNRQGFVFEKGYGVAIFGETSPVSAGTVMAIGSLTKSFTALAILQLEEDGLLSLDDPVTKFLPWFRSADKSKSDAITLRMCLQNTTGLSPSFQSLTNNQSRDPAALETGVRALSSYRMSRTPGQSFEYLNEGWNVLGLIVEVVTGQAYEQFIAERIFAPLKMQHTSAVRSVLESWQVATGHYAGVEPVPAEFIHIQGSLPAGSGLYSNAEDLGNYLLALLNGGRFADEQVITSDGVEEMWADGAPMMVLPVEMGGSGEPASYGMGWIVLTIDGHKYVGHGGEFRTMSSMALLDPERGVAVALLYNTGELNGYTNETPHHAALNALRLASGLPLSDYGVPRQADPSLNGFLPDASIVDTYTGTYLSDSGRKLRLMSGGSEGLRALLSESIYPADFDVDFVNSTNVVLRNIAGAQSGNVDIDMNGNIMAVNLRGESFRKQSARPDESLRSYRSSSTAYSFELPEQWQVTQMNDGFSASLEADNGYSIVGEATEIGFREWLVLLREKYPGRDPGVSSELRNGRFCQNVALSFERANVARQAISIHCVDGNRTFVTTAEVPFGELTQIVIEPLNRYLDSLDF